MAEISFNLDIFSGLKLSLLITAPKTSSTLNCVIFKLIFSYQYNDYKSFSTHVLLFHHFFKQP